MSKQSFPQEFKYCRAAIGACQTRKADKVLRKGLRLSRKRVIVLFAV
jgi:hypothetical protein